MAEEQYDLKESKRSVRELYPVLKDAYGNIIDGYHRLRADPNWKTETLEHIKTPTQLALARIIANTHRRSISREERAEQIEGLAKSLMENDKVPKEELIPTIAELTTFTDRYIRDLLPDEYKRRYIKSELSSELDEETLSKFGLKLEELGITVPAGETPRPKGAEEPSTAPLPEEAPATLEEEEEALAETLSILDYIKDYFRRYPLRDKENINVLIWSLQRKYGITREEAQRHYRDFDDLTKPKPRTTTRTFKPTQQPTCCCPLCKRDGADRNLIMLNVEDPLLAQLTLTEFITEAFKR